MTTLTQTTEASRPVAQTGRRFGLKQAMIYLFLGSFCLFTILAFAWVVLVSLKTNQEFFATSPWSLPLDPQFANYVEAWNRGISVMFQNSLLVAVSATVFSVGLSCLAAYPISRIEFRWNQHILIFFLLGIMIPYTLTAIPLFFMIESFRRVVPVDSRLVLIVLYTVAGFPFNTYVMTGFYKSLPGELEEAAAMDGASPFRAFLQIMLPLATPGVASLAILNFLSWWNEFFYALLFTRDKEAYTIPLGLVLLDQQALYTARWVNLFAGMVISVLPVLLVFALLQRQVTRGLTVGALKG